MGLLDKLTGLLGKKKADKLNDLADLNKDGQVNMDDLNKAKDVLDVNDDGKINKQDLNSVKEKFNK